MNKQENNNLMLTEHYGIEKYVIATFVNTKQATDYINKNYKEYGAKVRKDDLDYALEYYNGTAWLYFDFFAISVDKVEE